MGGYKLEKDLIFYHAREPGAVFTFKAGNLMTEKMLKETLDHLQYETEKELIGLKNAEKYHDFKKNIRINRPGNRPDRQPLPA